MLNVFHPSATARSIKLKAAVVQFESQRRSCSNGWSRQRFDPAVAFVENWRADTVAP